jgi:hypothetical protein
VTSTSSTWQVVHGAQVAFCVVEKVPSGQGLQVRLVVVEPALATY